MRFGHKSTHTNMQCRPPSHFLVPDFDHLEAEVGNRPDIFFRFTGMSDHEVQFDSLPTPLVNLARHCKQLIRTDGLIDGVAHSFGSCFRSQCEPSLAGTLQIFQQVK